MVSMAVLFTFGWAGQAKAHETQPAIATVNVTAEAVGITLRLNAETMLSGVDASLYSDTNDAPEAAEYDRLRGLSDDALRAEFEAAWPELSQGFTLRNTGPLSLVNVEVAPQSTLELSRETTLTLSAVPEEGAEGVNFGWNRTYGTLIVRQERGEDTYAAMLQDGETSVLLPVTGLIEESMGETFLRFLIEGFEHIIPKGLDHILFVLGLFFFALHWKPLLTQVTAFTLAHTVTLALATLGYITIPDEWMWLVEALIALSITYVAIENILRPTMGWWRPAVVFGFGLLHGLGFASVLGDLGLSQGMFVISLIAFNVGVEVGQLAVILGMFILIMIGLGAAHIGRLDAEEAMVREGKVMYRAVSIVGSLMIGIVGAYWFIERAFL